MVAKFGVVLLACSAFILTGVQIYKLDVLEKIIPESNITLEQQFYSDSSREVDLKWHQVTIVPHVSSIGIDKAPLIDTSKQRRDVYAIVMVNSAPKRYLRRKSTRATWMKECNKKYKNSTIICFFVTEHPDSIKDKTLAERILEESRIHQDIIFFKEPTAGLRLMYHMKWIAEHFNFSYLLRLDDDVMLCVEHFLRNLANFPAGPHLWGWLHCNRVGMTYIDEGIQMYTADLIYAFFSQKKENMTCQNIGDQTIAIWLRDLKLNTTEVVIADNERIHHNPPASRMPIVMKRIDVCHRYIAVHGVYAEEMLKLWERRGSGNFNVQPMFNVKDYCPHKPSYEWKYFAGYGELYGGKPQLCFGGKFKSFSNLGGREGNI